MALMKDINDKVYKIIGSCMDVHRTLGPGYPVDFYRKALEVELPQRGLTFEAQKTLQVEFKDVLVGSLVLDFLIGEKVALVVRCQDNLFDYEVQQMLRFLQLTNTTIGVLVNFGLMKIQYKRVLPTQMQRDPQKQPLRPLAYREIGKTREGNPIV